MGLPVGTQIEYAAASFQGEIAVMAPVAICKHLFQIQRFVCQLCSLQGPPNTAGHRKAKRDLREDSQGAGAPQMWEREVHTYVCIDRDTHAVLSVVFKILYVWYQAAYKQTWGIFITIMLLVFHRLACWPCRMIFHCGKTQHVTHPRSSQGAFGHFQVLPL